MRLLPIVLLALAGCSVAPSGEPPAAAAPPALETPDRFDSMADYERERAAALAALDAEIGTAAAQSEEACRVVAVGEKACGGPTDYRVYAATSADPARVEALARRVSRLDAVANRQFELASTCEFREPPQTALRGGRCVAQTGGQG